MLKQKLGAKSGTEKRVGQNWLWKNTTRKSKGANFARRKKGKLPQTQHKACFAGKVNQKSINSSRDSDQSSVMFNILKKQKRNIWK